MSVSADAAPRRVLVVSGDPEILTEARSGFPLGFDVSTVGDARQAVEILGAGPPPDLLIVDLQTGSAGGFALARDLSQIPRLASIPILMLLERDQDLWLAHQAGAAAVRTKPLDVDQLVGAALNLLS
jgi:two-component system, OmpR family, response regulator MprA